ncbi:hypothetical protein CDV31_002410 [Fusarium ambrosium]|uniref:Uncharacterized protein n=1 Tax=Fusarium ambrosium TaxID=131363 RepID=A0A428UWT4_9HYPO|nr:hypothetical protein CDV31_002410 [Fusarium ambrosium]
MATRNHLPAAIHTIYWNDDDTVRRLAQRRQSRKESSRPKPHSRPRRRHYPSSGGTYFTSRNVARQQDPNPWLSDSLYLSSPSASVSTTSSSPSPGSHSTFETTTKQGNPKSDWTTSEPDGHPQSTTDFHTNYQDIDGFYGPRDDMSLIMDFLGISDGELAALVGPQDNNMK